MTLSNFEIVSDVTKEYFCVDERPWVVGYSGGKDSSLVIKILLTSLSGLNHPKEVNIFYCDTGVEIPVLRDHIIESLKLIQAEGLSLGINIKTTCIKPPLKDHYFVKVIGRGYPTPTNKFRWCTDKLRINPVQQAIKEIVGEEETIVVLGTRYNESNERDKILKRNETDNKYFFKQTGHKNTILFSPIRDFSTDDVWESLLTKNNITSINASYIADIYRQISGECPIIRLPDSTPCSKGRFGCWTCTVVRQDKATSNLIKNGFRSLEPLLEFRSWILSIRDDTNHRCTVRRNGVRGLGPFRLKSREIILNKLLETEKKSGFTLISEEEIETIYKLWEEDKASPKYQEDPAIFI
ncbi:phosphoadenosine phosphosulfate reductase family protein [Sansalvadorimonas sp. 2012CJ34-2]|uniref:Phosphoadenosine phosphosulfate reductase family protein n=1 Tax=Parendozoicomonas callyspongiae TaxID=2942213 RepID=A0ABT0PLH1_9GAMM|nr:phosphoadenosine phosphosulfate reductase family protein [Sansalvadorimonas sp. 2012CJ34-2]MCL6272240.1 phosphoadenosine phosphosulfate reductase family protein [Sansalvadorimonas sp. 2012CJ34-2]